MELANLIENLSTTQARLTAALPDRLRSLYKNQSLRDKRGCMVIGPRGVGKTTFLLMEAKNNNSLYISTDNPIISPFSLTDLAEAAFGNGYDGITFDEIHFAKNWSVQIKSIYDNHPLKKIWVSDSSSLILRKGIADLSRRFPKLEMPFLSFREYLHLKLDIDLEPFDPLRAQPKDFDRPLKSVNILRSFKEYLREGFRPIFLEGDYSAKILGIIEKTIFYDVPFFVPSIQENHLRLMNAVIGFLATSPIPTLNIDQMAREWSIGKEKLYQLLEVLEQVGLIHIVRFPKDFKVSGKGAKIFFADPSMYSALSGNLGNTREAFVVTMFRQASKAIHACKDEHKGDFVVGTHTLEIGGRNKSLKGSDFVIRDNTDLPGKKSIPLWSLGMMY